MWISLQNRSWALPWSCGSSGVQWVLRKLATAITTGCHHLGLTICRPLLARIQCEDWMLTAVAGLVSLFIVLYLSRMYRWYAPKQSGTLAAAAAAAAVELRRANPRQYPPASHSWFRISGRQLAKPLLCAVCFDHLVATDDDGAMMNTCEVCGEVAHESCARHVPHDCRPIAVDGGDMNHLWRPAGITTSTAPDDVEAPLQVCHYCQHLCEADAFCWEPIWECACCFAVAHVRCYHRVHPKPTVDSKCKGNKVEGKDTEEQEVGPINQNGTAIAHDSRQHSSNSSGEVAALASATTGRNGLPRIRTPRRGSYASSAQKWPSNRGADSAEGAVGTDSLSAAAAAPQGNSAWEDDGFNTSGWGPALQQPHQPSRGLGSHSRVGSMGRLMTALSAMVSDVADTDAPQQLPFSAVASVPSRPLRQGESHIARLNRCGLGAHWRLVMPPTAFREVPSVTWSARAKSLLPSRPGRRASNVDGGGSGAGSTPGEVSAVTATQSAAEQVVDTSAAVGAAAVAATTKVVQTATAAAASMAAQCGGSPPAEPDGAGGSSPLAGPPQGARGWKQTSRRSRPRHTQPAARPGHSWWGLSRDTPWHNYSLGQVPPGLKPILVFINTKSGPQTGRDFRRKFLRVLHPLQVVELPRERPDRALALFADVAGLRLLVVGGDGTVGWVLSCLDALQEQRQREAVAMAAATHDNTSDGSTHGTGAAGGTTPQPWLPPPMAVFPIGTGNDLARCLNWGGNMSAHQGAGVSHLLALLEQSAVTLLDRWKVTFSPLPPPQKQTPKHAAPQRDDGSRAPSTAPALERIASLATKGVTAKAMNNYMGIGIDAKVALEFHHIREQYPEWFHSQFGNKLWYTGVGAKDMLAHSSLHLSTRIKLECDGVEVAVPPDTEGILLLNIPSYMGGVNIWASGRPAGGTAAVERPQSMCDRRLEVVAVYGSWHLGRMQVGLSQARRLVQCTRARITLLDSVPMQVDGEPWKQAACEVEVTHRNAALMLRHLSSAPLARMAAAVSEALDSCQAKALITPTQRHALTTELAAHLHSVT